jgi:hypothetical protein
VYAKTTVPARPPYTLFRGGRVTLTPVRAIPKGTTYADIADTVAA